MRLQVGWPELRQGANLVEALKNLKATDFSRPGEALKTSLDLMNLFRLKNGIDNYAKGRNPWFSHNSVILAITDGGLSTSAKGTTGPFSLPLADPKAGSELTMEPFRWDQRLYNITLRVSGTGVRGSVPPL